MRKEKGPDREVEVQGKLDNDLELLFLIVLNKGKHAKRPRQPMAMATEHRVPSFKEIMAGPRDESAQILEWKAMEIARAGAAFSASMQYCHLSSQQSDNIYIYHIKGWPTL